MAAIEMQVSRLGLPAWPTSQAL